MLFKKINELANGALILVQHSNTLYQIPFTFNGKMVDAVHLKSEQKCVNIGCKTCI